MVTTMLTSFQAYFVLYYYIQAIYTLKNYFIYYLTVNQDAVSFPQALYNESNFSFVQCHLNLK